MSNDNPSDKDLGIPDIPMKKAIIVKQSTIRKDTSETKFVLIECEICSKTISMPVPRKIIQNSTLPVTDVTYIHGNPQHAITAQLDVDFAVRRRRTSQIVYEKDYLE
ncbi:MAG: hypothetical protein EU530_08005 [Promethearchaeota archaeon]|nr:MAG: hypothetical protein EU530_08005 [Candidatus Lokiarchaeota archaeon]